MATIEENVRVWNETYAWPSAGDEWSLDFGGTEALWYFVLFPRIHQFIPARVILEIAPGFGRWTQFLKAQCESLIGVDISEKCVAHCRSRFADAAHARFYVNDGASLDDIKDNSVDLIFSFDSLVHAEKDVMQAYVLQLADKLAPEGIAFLHHSNLGAYPGRLRLLDYYHRLPSLFKRKLFTRETLSAMLSINFKASRAKSMTAELLRQYCHNAGMECVSQEFLNWGTGKCLIDTISVIARTGSHRVQPTVRMENTQFVATARVTSQLADLYCR
jgi:SAM-dependent methyltransferase